MAKCMSIYNICTYRIPLTFARFSLVKSIHIKRRVGLELNNIALTLHDN